MAPVLGDGLVGGNCGIVWSALGQSQAGAADLGGSGERDATTAGGGAQAPDAEDGGGPGSCAGGGILVSRSGKSPGMPLQAQDWVLLTSFDAQRWEAEYRSARDGACPTSDAPLHAAALGLGLGLGHDPAHRWGWPESPLAAVHGHALADGAGLELARQKGFPISDEETLFSTPQDLAALEALFLRHPYPRHRCHIRRGHGFLLLGRSLSEVEDFFEQHINPGPSTGTAAATHAGTCV